MDDRKTTILPQQLKNDGLQPPFPGVIVQLPAAPAVDCTPACSVGIPQLGEEALERFSNFLLY